LTGDSKQNKYRAAKSEKKADIGELPAVVDPDRKALAMVDPLFFLTTYFPSSTGLSPFSSDHLKVIENIHQAVLYGGLTANFVYRGFAKTTISENMAIWAAICGHRLFTAILGVNLTASSDNIDSIKRELAENDLLYADFPEVCHAVRHLENKPQRCASQTYRGKSTHIVWRADKIVFPSIPGSPGSGAILTAKPFMKARGLKHKMADGRNIRPSFIIIDDPQDDEIASNRAQVDKALKTMKKSILQSGGHDKPLAAVVNATRICRGDLTERLIDDPAWQTACIPMVKSWADKDAHENDWLKTYRDLRYTYNPDIDGDKRQAALRATEYYRQNRERMDSGCVVSWEHCFDSEEISAIQHAYNRLIDYGEDVFASEYQQQPLDDTENTDKLKPEDVMSRLNGYKRGDVPRDAQRVTCMIDMHGAGKVLWWCAVAVKDGFTGYVIDYGAWPPQGKAYINADRPQVTLQDRYPGVGPEAAVQAGLQDIAGQLLKRSWPVSGGGAVQTELLLCDAGWKPEIAAAVKMALGAGNMDLSRGRGIGAGEAPLSAWKREPGDQVGHYWRISRPKSGRDVRYTWFDSNYWKSFVHDRFLTAPGDSGAFTLWGQSEETHRMFADHVAASERGELTIKPKGKAIEWKKLPGTDNHLLDCLVGCCVAACRCGLMLTGQATQQKSRKRYSQSDLNKLMGRRG